MGKKKRRILQKINPEKSNKMIYAVGVGLVIIFTVFFILISRGTHPKNKRELVSGVLGYLTKTQGIIDLVILPEKNNVQIRYDGLDRKDFFKITTYAGIKLSLKLKGERIKVELFRDNEKQPVYTIFLKNGTILKEERSVPAGQ